MNPAGMTLCKQKLEKMTKTGAMPPAYSFATIAILTHSDFIPAAA